jgi:hypothetical protein
MFCVEASHQGYLQGPDAMFRLRAGCAVSLIVSDLVSGGITGAIGAISIVAAAGWTVFPHVFCPIHVYLAYAFPNVESVERIPEESRADPLHRPLCNVPTAREGKISPGGVRNFNRLGGGGKAPAVPRCHCAKGNPSPATDAGSNLLEPA